MTTRLFIKTKKFQKQTICSYIAISFVAIILFSGKAESQEKSALPEIKAWELKTMTITDKQKVVLDFTRKMCVWTIGRENLATNEVLVTDLADQIIGASYEKTLPVDKNTFSKYAVSETNFDYKIDISLSEKQDMTIFVGSTENSPTTYMRINGDNTIYLLNGSLAQKIVMEREYWLPKAEGK